MNSKIIVLSSIMFLVNSFLQANSTDALKDSAEVYYKKAQYQSAIDCYEQILNTNLESAELYYNLGNAYYKKGELALSIVNYERALKINPSDEDILFNLKMVRSQTVDKIEILPEIFIIKWYKNFVNWFSSNNWAYASIIAFILALALLLVFLFSRNTGLKKTSFSVALLSFVLTIVFMVSAYHSKQDQFDKTFAIIRTPSVNVKSSPDENTTSLFILHTGTKLQIIEQLQGWYKIKIANGNVGWLKRDDFIEI